jgi:hypothetical protein
MTDEMYTYTQHALYFQPAARPVVTGPGPPVGVGGGGVDVDVVEVDVTVVEPVLLYTLSLLGPPQNSELLPLQSILQPEAGAGAPPFVMELPQSGRD